MNIINIGGWYVGNTAVLDWMDGFQEISFVKGDFNIMRLEDGIMDMINAPSKEIKIRMIEKNKKDFYVFFMRRIKFIVGRYTKNILKKKLNVNYDNIFSSQKILYSYLNTYKVKVEQEIKFDEIVFWKEWLNKVSLIYSEEKDFKNTVYQNPFFYDETFSEHKYIWPKLLAPYKLMFVHRDPLDQFSDIVNSNSHLNVSWPRFHGGTENMHPADRFLAISKNIYNARLRMADEYEGNQLVIFSFEDFLRDHNRITNKLEFFLEIEKERDSNNKRFVIEDSIKNIGKGKFNEEAIFLLKDKNYVMEEINHLRSKLINHSSSI